MPTYTVIVTRPVLRTQRYRVRVTDQILADCGYEADAAALVVLDGRGLDPGAEAEALTPPTYTETGVYGRDQTLEISDAEY